MTGPFSPPRAMQTAWIAPLGAFLWSGSVPDHDRLTAGELAEISLVCLAAGVLWQVLHRRDLADRLTHFASAFTVFAALFVVLSFGEVGRITQAGSLGVSVGGVIAGLVWAEQWFRWREHRRSRAGAPAERWFHAEA